MADEKPRNIDDRPNDEIARTLDEYDLGAPAPAAIRTKSISIFSVRPGKTGAGGYDITTDWSK
jgi:hypothetical protein